MSFFRESLRNYLVNRWVKWLAIFLRFDQRTPKFESCFTIRTLKILDFVNVNKIHKRIAFIHFCASDFVFGVVKELLTRWTDASHRTFLHESTSIIQWPGKNPGHRFFPLLAGVNFLDALYLHVLVMASLASGHAATSAAATFGARVADRHSGGGGAIQLHGHLFLVKLPHGRNPPFNFYPQEPTRSS